MYHTHSWHPLINKKQTKQVFWNEISHGNYFIVHSTLRFERSGAKYCVCVFFLLSSRLVFCFLSFMPFYFLSEISSMTWMRQSTLSNFTVENLLDCRFNHSTQIDWLFQANSNVKFHRVGHSFRFPFSSFVCKHQLNDTATGIVCLYTIK